MKSRVLGIKRIKNTLYTSKTIFKCFVNEMKQKYHDAFQNYNDGKGGELKHGNSRYGMIPPKMSSVASSSRFIYLTFRKKIVHVKSAV